MLPCTTEQAVDDGECDRRVYLKNRRTFERIHVDQRQRRWVGYRADEFFIGQLVHRLYVHRYHRAQLRRKRGGRQTRECLVHHLYRTDLVFREFVRAFEVVDFDFLLFGLRRAEVFLLRVAARNSGK